MASLNKKLGTANGISSIQEYKDSVKAKAEDVILKGFPSKIVQLNELLHTQQFQKQDFSDIHETLNTPIQVLDINGKTTEPPSKKWKRDDSLALISSPNVPCNKHICDLINILKPHIRQLIEDANLLKVWISFMIPKIEAGNNFGVAVQEDILTEIQLAESENAAYLDHITKYFVSRAKVVSKVAKHPHVEDYRKAVHELDEQEYVSLQLTLREVRNRYCTLHDMVFKNLEKLKMPRTSNAENLY